LNNGRIELAASRWGRKFVSTNQLSFEGKTLKPNNVITHGPYAEVKEIIGGYVEVRNIMQLN
jgi:hypothetical protein